MGVLASAETLSRMFGFRNLIVHWYEFIDTQVLIDVVNGYLSDFDYFRASVIAHVES